jgi:hypothetical protein
MVITLKDAYDDFMRKKLNYQMTDYVLNNELICFGLSEHQIKEEMPKYSEKAAKHISLVSILNLSLD